MPKCMVRKGFFVLSDCGEFAELICPSCSRPFCEEHAGPTDGNCVECWSREQLANDEEKATEETDGNFRYVWRERYLRDSKVRTFYTGKYMDHYYDDYDLQSFRNKDRLVDVGEYDGDSFYDS